jgi:hypothetical protein
MTVLGVRRISFVLKLIGLGGSSGPGSQGTLFYPHGVKTEHLYFLNLFLDHFRAIKYIGRRKKYLRVRGEFLFLR